MNGQSEVRQNFVPNTWVSAGKSLLKKDSYLSIENGSFKGFALLSTGIRFPHVKGFSNRLFSFCAYLSSTD
jgi:hypothetical protein